MIAIIDYDMGNLRSVAKGFEKVGATAVATRDPRAILDASHVVLPGVGAFKDCMKNLEDYGLVEPIIKSIEKGKPFLGICLGLQLLFEESTEFGLHRGLGVLKGRVVRFPEDRALKVPHMGWNEATRCKDSLLLEGIDDKTFFYFVHSYYAVPEDRSINLTTTGYGVEFTSSVQKDNIMACQFHPEKSQRAGLKVLKNFSQMR
ncbi:MAG TPA: imidazole glycerol phosphate synthase subunit HisH [Deltaproteobacteria bacterium]|nr:MAG: imidazole glycerol phosphate synthase, glutamine amidotransferase subunit [Deltaproteobacteria bacterium GWA2_55_82]OGQ62283.1 MAG: imidazole glycerol phosphate synthase, glutamine amidotransferase subunit [Deltaproteobacteria bacterium RIFCSPLOWO2_02_FULL_55_12]OIJ74395.1 MAG: imidazole glycerol phosphate synthase, glutamine amidotransferase subunit [Deltaproteobacteria bacterium GWC2_55_46]HBG47044.1 imidazole glycerol phosphate synthase subunit HisH [Deltaproteobacteria bacterium]HCY